MNKRYGKILYSLWLTKDEEKFLKECSEAEMIFKSDIADILIDALKRGDLDKK